MKKLLLVTTLLMLIFTLSGCFGNTESDNIDDNITTNSRTETALQDIESDNFDIVGTWEDEEDENVVLFTKDGVYFMCSTNPEFYYSYYIADYTYEDGELTFDDYEYENGYEVRWVFWNVEESLDYLFGNGDCALIDGYFYVYLGGNIHKFSKISDNVDYNKDIYDNFKIYR